MIKITDKSDCCGCTACASVCAHGAISMQPDTLGFLYPVADAEKCVDCGLCDKICAFNSNYNKAANLENPMVLGARHKNMNEVMKSRSGAVFVALSDYVFEQGGVIYGAGYEDHFRVVHKRAITKEERDEFRGSKYVQSDLSGIFKLVKRDLKDGLLVLFSGTPCQTAGLNSFVGKKFRENLILVDIVCHGVPGPFVWRDYLQYLENKNGITFDTVNFRNKELFGWGAHVDTYTSNGSTIYNDELTYTTIFYSEIATRKSCSKCPYTNMMRPSDITLADFWGSEKTNPKANADDKGVSLLLINTPQGIDLLRKIEPEVNTFEVLTDDYIQPNLERPTPPHPKRDQFEELYAKKGFVKAMVHFRFMGLPKRFDVFISRQKRRIVKYAIKILHIQ